MITIKHTNGIISEVDLKKVPETCFGKHSNGTEWLFFETLEEKDKFYADNFPSQPEQPTEETNPLLDAVKQMTAEEKAELKKLLG